MALTGHRSVHTFFGYYRLGQVGNPPQPGYWTWKRIVYRTSNMPLAVMPAGSSSYFGRRYLYSSKAETVKCNPQSLS